MSRRSFARGRAAVAAHSWIVRGLVPLSAALLCIPALTGCKTGTGVRPALSATSPDWESLNVRTLAYLGFGSSVGDEPARVSAEELVEQALTGSQTRFTVLTHAQAYSKASAGGSGETFERAVSTWRDRRLIDQFAVQELCRVIAVDGIILGDLSDWKRERLELTDQGSSYTQIAMKLSIYSGKTGLEAWNAYQMKRRDAAEYTAGFAGASTYTDETGRAVSQSTSSVVPEPPRPEQVVAEILESIFAAFPARPATAP